jgi:hypothetical protein
VIEMKKTTSQESDDFDVLKLKAFKLQLDYQFAAFIKVQTNGQAGVENVTWV